MCPWDVLTTPSPQRRDLFLGSQERRGRRAPQAVGARTPEWIPRPECLSSAACCVGEGGEEAGYSPRRAHGGGSDHLGRESLVKGRAWDSIFPAGMGEPQPWGRGRGARALWADGGWTPQVPDRRKLCLLQKPTNGESQGERQGEADLSGRPCGPREKNVFLYPKM